MGNCLDTCLVKEAQVDLTAKKGEKSKVYPLTVENTMLEKPSSVDRMERDTTEGGDDTRSECGGDMKNPSLLQFFSKGGEDGGCELKKSMGAPGDGGVLRIKIVLTKQQVAQLLSRCDDGQSGVLMDVASELRKIGNNLADVGPPRGPGSDAWRPVLETIPEESP